MEQTDAKQIETPSFNDMIFKMPPSEWEHFLPLGNGRLGAMVKAHPCNEVIQLNEESIWSGGPADRTNPDAKKYLPKVQKLVKEGKVLQAQELAFQTLSATCPNERVYQTAGEVRVDFFSKNYSGIESGYPLQHGFSKKCLETYSAKLSLDNSCVTVQYTDEEDTTFTRKTWISAKEDMIFMHVTASKKNAINFSLYVDRGIWVDSVFTRNNFIFLQDSHGIPFCLGVGAVSSGGKISTKGVMLTGSNCDSVLFFIDIQAWKYKSTANKTNLILDKCLPKDKYFTAKQYNKQIKKNTWFPLLYKKLLQTKNTITKDGIAFSAENILKKHIAEYRSYWDRASIKIGNDIQVASENKTVSSLLENIKSSTPNANDVVSLINLYANFSRYLLISGSREPGTLPLTLQGLWNCYIDPPWGSKYTVNINAQMNYWPVNITSLCECETPLFNLLERAYPNGRYVAKKMYGCRGFVMHHNTDFWGDCAPQDYWIPGTYWVLGAAWLATHIWEHFEYTQNKGELKRYYYLLHEACLFFVDFLKTTDSVAPDGKPYLVISPSVSPENSYTTKLGQVGAFCEGCQMDNMILKETFTDCIKAYKVLKNDCVNKNGKLYPQKDFEDFEYVLAHIKEPEKNSDGSLMEWNKEVLEVEPGHRHISHLYGLFPGNTIQSSNEELKNAAIKTLEKRLQNGGGHTGWSQAWIINFWVQLQKGNNAVNALYALLKNSTLPNLLDNHPPFQIDGNFGSLAAICRMFVQSYIKDNGEIHVKLLPALPDDASFACGSIKGLHIKGDYFVNFDWQEGKAQNIEFVPGINANKDAKIIVE